MIGVEERDTQSGIHVVRVHYTADPAKRDEEALDRLAVGMLGGRKGRAWKREMEIDWTIASGLGVYSELFIREMHVAKEPLLAHKGLPLYRGWDFGLTPACVICQVDPSGRLNVLDELVTWTGRGGMAQQGIEQFCPVVTLRCNQDYPGVQWLDKADPAGWQKAQTDEKSCVQVMNEYGFYPAPGPVSWLIRKRAMVEMLQRLSGGRAQIVVSPTCKMLIEGFAGAYRFEEIGQTGNYKETVEKNAWSHVMNGLEYVVGCLYAPPVRSEEGSTRKRRRSYDGVTGY